MDIGCGPGHQVLGAAQVGAKLAVGVDKTEISLRFAEATAEKLCLTDSVRFTTNIVSSFGTEWADVALSQNSFEHFNEPGRILDEVYAALRPGGLFFVTFSPPWWHPYGAHHYFMIRLPWAHLFFSEKTILRVRQLYRPNKPMTWDEVSLNQMTIAKFLSLIRDSQFILSEFLLKPIGPLPRVLTRLRLFREWTNTMVSVILSKPIR